MIVVEMNWKLGKVETVTTHTSHWHCIFFSCVFVGHLLRNRLWDSLGRQLENVH